MKDKSKKALIVLLSFLAITLTVFGQCKISNSNIAYPVDKLTFDLNQLDFLDSDDDFSDVNTFFIIQDLVLTINLIESDLIESGFDLSKKYLKLFTCNFLYPRGPPLS